MTATPTSTSQQEFAPKWFRRCVSFPVLSLADMLVAGTTTVSAVVVLPIVETQVVVPLTVPSAAWSAHVDFLRQDSTLLFGQAANLIREATFREFAEKVVEWAVKDRETNPGGGALVFVKTLKVPEEGGFADGPSLINYVNERAVQLGFRAAERKNGDTQNDSSVGVCVAQVRDCLGYDATRLGVVVRGVYESNIADRHQGWRRIVRVSQRRGEVFDVRLVPQNTILSILYERQERSDKLGKKLEDVADVFIKQIETGSEDMKLG